MAEGGAGGKEVGRISIRVVPNTDRFRRDLRAQLEEIEREIQGRIEVNVDLDTGAAAARFEALMAALRAQGARGVRVDVDVDRDRFAGALTRMRRSLDNLANGNSRLNRAWREMRAGFGDLGRATNDARGHLGNYNREVDTLSRRLRRSYQDMGPLTSRFQAHGEMLRRGRQHIRDFNEALRDQQRWMRQQDPDLSRNAARWRSWMMAMRDANTNATNGFRRFRQAYRELRNSTDEDGNNGFLSRLGQAFRSLGRDSNDAGNGVEFAGRKFLGLSRIGWIVVGVFAAAAPVIGLVAGILAGLPSLVSAFGAGAAAIALGMDGIKKAASTLKPEFEHLKQTVSGVFQERLTPQFEQLKAIFPVLESGMSNVANGLSDMFQGVTDALTSEKGLGQIQTILNNTGTFFSSLKPAMDQFTQSWLTLSEAGSNSFGLLSGSINTFATNFNAMVDRITSNGVFEGAMQGLSQTLDGILNLFNRLMESGATAMGSLGTPIQNLLNGFGDFAVAAMPALTSLASMIGNIVGSLGNNLAPIITALTPAFQMLAGTLSTVFTGAFERLSPVLTQVATALNGAILGALQALQPVLPQLLDSFGQLATVLGQSFVTVINGLAPVLPTLATAFAQLAMIIAGVLTQALTAIQPYLPQLMQAFTSILNAVIPLIPVFVQLIADALVPLIPAFVQMIPAILPAIQAFADLLVKATPLIQIFAEISGAILGLVATLLAKLIGAIVSVVAEIADFVASCERALAAVLNWISEMLAKVGLIPGQVKSALGDLGSLLVGAGKALMDGLLSGIKSGFESVKNFVSSIAGTIASLKGPIPYDKIVLIPNGEALMQGLDEGIQSGLDGVLGTVKSIVGQLGDTIQGEKSGLVGAAQDLMSGVRQVFGDTAGMGIVIIVANFKESVNEITDVAKTAKASASDMVKSATDTSSVTSSTKKLDEQTKQKIADMRQQAEDLSNQAKDLRAKANETKDKNEKKRLREQAQGLQDQAKDLREQAQQMKTNGAEFANQMDSMVADTDKVGPQMETKGETIMQRLQRGLQNGWAGVQDELRKMADDFGTTFGIEDFSGKFDKILTDSKFATLPQDFAKATGDQFLSDLGIQGNGFIPELFKQGATYIFQVNSVDEAIQAKQTQQNKEKLQYTRR
jgi:phage-related protein